jgi:hypothetical protein
MPNICSIDNCSNNASFILKGIGKLCKEHNQNDSKKIKNIYCYDKKCLSIGKFGNKDSENKYCNKHKSNKMLNISANKCKNINCNKEAIYNFKEKKDRLYCIDHKEVGMINISYKYCDEKECYDRAYYAISGKSSSHCKKHKSNDMILADVKRCKDCSTVATFGIKGNKVEYCVQHKKDNMLCITTKLCEGLNCTKNATYCITGETPIFCKIHKINDMKVYRKENCMFNGCPKTPSYNFIGMQPKYCEDHIESGMINIKSKKCIENECNIQPTFGLLSKVATHCCKHKKEGMFDVYHKLCESNNCRKRCSFGFVDKEIKFCTNHKENEMVNLQDLTWKCTTDKCMSRSKYGKPGIKRTKCYAHREQGMIKRPNGKCLDCRMCAIYGQNYIPYHCETHKLDDDVNLVEMPCASCSLIMVLDKDNKCEYCNPEMFKRTQLAKQNALMSYLDNIKLNGNSTDRTVDGGICGLERPDRVYDCIDYIIILECDENQHRERNCVCEQTRMINIGQSFGGMPVYFIRFNPDDYIPDNEKIKPEEIKKRYKLVGDLIKSMIEHKIDLPKVMVSSIYLYFDGWTSFKNEKWKTLLVYEKV